MTISNCMGCDEPFGSKTNTRPLCGKCKKKSRDLYLADGGSEEEFRDEITLLKGA
jgi:hypothetical protein